MEYSTSIAHQAKILSEMAEDVRKRLWKKTKFLLPALLK